MKHRLIRVFGMICVIIGIGLMVGLIPALGEMWAHATTRRELSGVMAMPMIGVLLVAFGVVGICRPDWLDNA